MQEQLPESDTRLSSRVELAHDNEGHEFAPHGKSGGCVVTVHALIWGDPQRKRLFEGCASGRNAGRVGVEVSSGQGSALSYPTEPPSCYAGRHSTIVFSQSIRKSEFQPSSFTARKLETVPSSSATL